MNDNHNLFSFEELNINSPWLKLKTLNWDKITENYKPTFYKKGTILYYSREITNNVFIIKEGRVDLSILNVDGNKKVIGVAESGSIIGELPIFDNKPNFCTAKICINSWIYKVLKEDFYKIVLNDSVLAENLFKNLTAKLRTLYTQVEYLSFKDSVSKIAMVLIALCKDHSEKVDNEYKITLPFSHNDIANITGLSRVSVSNAISNLVSQNLVLKKDGNYYVKDLEKLKEIINAF